MTGPNPEITPGRSGAAQGESEARSWKSVNAEITIRWWPRTHWVRVGFSLTGSLEPSWRPQSMYRGLVGRIAWPLLAGRGPFLLWLRETPKEEPRA